MARKKISAWLDETVKPVAEGIGLGGAYGTFRAAAVLIGDPQIDIPDLGGAVADAGAAVAGALQPIKPIDALKALAEGLNEAERVLNDRNLALATGKLDIRMVVDVGGAGAEANFTLNIGPVPDQ